VVHGHTHTQHTHGYYKNGRKGETDEGGGRDASILRGGAREETRTIT
jgi:hypothetical protein